MQKAGIDIGSRSIEFVLLDQEEITYMYKCDTGMNPLLQIEQLLKSNSFSSLVATGYGRQLVQKNYPCESVTEIKAYATALKKFHPTINAVLDIGGQDTKAILLSDDGIMKKFEMNDKCAAGTGKFLEIMAMTMGVSIQEFGPLALLKTKELTINNTCTVFAETEVVSLITSGISHSNIANAIHKSAAQKAASMVNKVAFEEKTILFAGGVAQNPAIVKYLEELTNKNIVVPKHPQFMGALGAALLAK